MTRTRALLTGLVCCSLFIILGCSEEVAEPASTSLKRPNFLFAIADDQSWRHTSATGEKAIATPAFDRIAEEGVLFTRAYVSAPSCTASRSSILTGQDFWRLRGGAQLHGRYPDDLPNYQRILADHGYHVGFTGKGWGPGYSPDGNPAGRAYNDIKIEKPVNRGFSSNDYSANFTAFLRDRKTDQPFSFWFSALEPHRPYGGNEHHSTLPNIDLNAIELPSFIPDNATNRAQFAEYLNEIVWFDRQLAAMLAILEDSGELDNTVVVVSSDNGMPFPRSKMTNYEYGVHVPFAVRWGEITQPNRVSTELISLTDLAPTFLELAGAEVPRQMTGESLAPILRHEAMRSRRDFVLTGTERHVTDARRACVGYPSRALYTSRFLYIRNLKPERWPAGDPPLLKDIDTGSYAKSVLVDRANEPAVQPFFTMAAGKRPAEELYDLENDPEQLNNLATHADFQHTLDSMRSQLGEQLVLREDPRLVGDGDVFERYAAHRSRAKTYQYNDCPQLGSE